MANLSAGFEELMSTPSNLSPDGTAAACFVAGTTIAVTGLIFAGVGYAVGYNNCVKDYNFDPRKK